MTEYFPGTWYLFSKLKGWIPSERKKKSDIGGPKERKKYDDAVGIVWRNAIHHAQHNNVSVVIGHTHCSGILRRAMKGVNTVMADGGKLEEQTYLVIEEDIRLCILSSGMSLQDITLSNLPRLQKLRYLHFARRPEICLELPRLITDYMKTKDDPADHPELRAAKRLKYVLENKRPIIEDDTLLAGTTTAKLTGAIMYPDFLALPMWPELETVHRRKKNPFGITLEEIEELNSKIFPYWMDKTVLEVARRKYDNPFCQRVMERIIFFICGKPGTISHTIPDYSSVVDRGLEAIKEDAEHEEERSMVNLKQGQNGAYYYQAVKLVIDGVLAYAENLSREAARLAEAEPNKKRKQELIKLHKICTTVPRKPSRTLHEALSAIWICKIALHQENANAGLSLGRLDQILYKRYSYDIKNGVLTLAEAVELLGCFWLKIADHVPLAPKLGDEIVGGAGSNQAITLGGVDSEGYDAVNDLTYVMLKVHQNIYVTCAK
jgi:formate C-acetyltransferase